MPILSENQERFVTDVQSLGLEVDYDYSGRFMYGEKCPAVRLEDSIQLAVFTTQAEICTDQMGKFGFVVYARR